MNRECAAVITSTGNILADPSSNGIRRGGNHSSHCARPRLPDSRSAGSTGRSPGAAASRSRNHVIDPLQPTRSAITVAGISARRPTTPGPGLDRRERRLRRPPHIPRRCLRGHRLDHRGPRDPQPLRGPRLRHPLRRQPPDQRPVLQSDHSPIVECTVRASRLSSSRASPPEQHVPPTTNPPA